MSETGNLKLKKHDNPETNTEKFDIENYLNGNWDKIDEAFGKDRDRLDLLEASNTIYDFKGKVDTLANLQLKTKTQGDVWYCEEDSTYYTYTGTDWIPVNLNLKLGVIDELKAKTIKCLQEVETPTPVSGTSIDLSDSADAKITELKISGNSKQETREGYNLLPYPYKEETKTLNGITWTINKDGSIKVSGTSTNTSFIDLYNNGLEMITTPNEKYTFALIKKDGDFGFSLHHYNYINGWTDIKTGKNIINGTGSSSSTGDLFRILVEGAEQTVNETIYPILLEGEYTEGTLPEYEQYGASPSPDYPSEVESCGDNGSINEVICNRNLFNTDVEQGSVSTDTGEKTSSEYSIRTEFIKVTPNKEYILKYSTDLTSDYNTKIVEFDKNKAFLKTTVALPPNKKLSITTNNQTEYVIIAIYSGTKLSPLTYTNYFKNIEFKQNDGSEYIEHKKQTYTIPTQQPFRARGDIRDTFIKKNNKWYERHYINRLILNGTESWEMIGTNTTGKYRFQTKVSPNEIVNNQDGDTYMQGFCNRLIMGTPNTTYLCQTGITTLSGYLIIYNEKATDTIDNFKAWLSSNNLTVDYLLKTPIDIECTEEQSTILFDIEQNAKTYDKVTHMYSTDKISSYKEVTYKKDIETLFANTLVEGV